MRKCLCLLCIAVLLLPSIAGAEGALLDDRGAAIPAAVPRRVVSLYGSYAEAWAQAGGTLVGAVIVGIINNVQTLMGVDSNIQKIVKGVIIVGAVIIDVVTKNSAKKAR